MKGFLGPDGRLQSTIFNLSNGGEFNPYTNGTETYVLIEPTFEVFLSGGSNPTMSVTGSITNQTSRTANASASVYIQSAVSPDLATVINTEALANQPAGWAVSGTPTIAWVSPTTYPITVVPGGRVGLNFAVAASNSGAFTVLKMVASGAPVQVQLVTAGDVIID
jgi:hypothetical protein